MSQQPIDLHEDEEQGNYDYDDLESWEEGHDFNFTKGTVHDDNYAYRDNDHELGVKTFDETRADHVTHDNEEYIDEESEEDIDYGEEYYDEEDNASAFDHEGIDDDEVLSDLSADIFDDDAHLLANMEEQPVAEQEPGLSLDQVPFDRDLRKVNSAAGAVLAERGLVRRENSKAMFVRPSAAVVVGADADRDERRAKRRDRREKKFRGNRGRDRGERDISVRDRDRRDRDYDRDYDRNFDRGTHRMPVNVQTPQSIPQIRLAVRPNGPHSSPQTEDDHPHHPSRSSRTLNARGAKNTDPRSDDIRLVRPAPANMQVQLAIRPRSTTQRNVNDSARLDRDYDDDRKDAPVRLPSRLSDQCYGESTNISTGGTSDSRRVLLQQSDSKNQLSNVGAHTERKSVLKREEKRSNGVADRLSGKQIEQATGGSRNYDDLRVRYEDRLREIEEKECYPRGGRNGIRARDRRSDGRYGKVRQAENGDNEDNNDCLEDEEKVAGESRGHRDISAAGRGRGRTRQHGAAGRQGSSRGGFAESYSEGFRSDVGSRDYVGRENVHIEEDYRRGRASRASERIGYRSAPSNFQKGGQLDEVYCEEHVDERMHSKPGRNGTRGRDRLGRGHHEKLRLESRFERDDKEVEGGNDDSYENSMSSQGRVKGRQSRGANVGHADDEDNIERNQATTQIGRHGEGRRGPFLLGDRGRAAERRQSEKEYEHSKGGDQDRWLRGRDVNRGVSRSAQLESGDGYYDSTVRECRQARVSTNNSYLDSIHTQKDGQAQSDADSRRAIVGSNTGQYGIVDLAANTDNGEGHNDIAEVKAHLANRYDDYYAHGSSHYHDGPSVGTRAKGVGSGRGNSRRQGYEGSNLGYDGVDYLPAVAYGVPINSARGVRSNSEVNSARGHRGGVRGQTGSRVPERYESGAGNTDGSCWDYTTGGAGEMYQYGEWYGMQGEGYDGYKAYESYYGVEIGTAYGYSTRSLPQQVFATQQSNQTANDLRADIDGPMPELNALSRPFIPGLGLGAGIGDSSPSMSTPTLSRHVSSPSAAGVSAIGQINYNSRNLNINHFNSSIISPAEPIPRSSLSVVDDSEETLSTPRLSLRAVAREFVPSSALG